MFAVNHDTLLDHVDDIITMVYQYINMLRTEGPQHWVFKEGQDLNFMNFKFKDNEKPSSLVTFLSSITRVSLTISLVSCDVHSTDMPTLLTRLPYWYAYPTDMSTTLINIFYCTGEIVMEKIFCDIVYIGCSVSTIRTDLWSCSPINFISCQL